MPALAIRVAAELARLTRDRVRRNGTIPRTMADLDVAWLSESLGGTVRSCERVAVTAGTTARARIRLDGDGVPPSVFVKLAPTALATRAFVDVMGLGATEVRFYREIAPDLPVAVPRAYAACADPATGRFVLLLEDLAARGCRFGDVARAAGADDAAAVVGALARLHAAFWNSPRFGRDLSWVASHAADPNNAVIRPLVRGALRRVARTHAGLIPPGARGLIDRRDDLERTLADGPITLLHGDPHLGNLYFDADGPGFLDWQVVRKGSGLRDLAYFLVLSLDGETRRAHQADFVKEYLRELGAAAPSFDEAWLRYRLETAYAWIAAVVTTGLGGLQAAEVAATGLRRAAAALVELETVAAARELLASRRPAE